MTDYIKGFPKHSYEFEVANSGVADKVFTIGLGLFMVAFFISIPFMYRDQQARLSQSWHDQGCQMYDNYLVKDVPAKCQTYFVDHYQAQSARVQPPEQN